MSTPITLGITATAQATHPDWVQLDEAGDPVLDERGEPVAKQEHPE